MLCDPGRATGCSTGLGHHCGGLHGLVEVEVKKFMLRFREGQEHPICVKKLYWVVLRFNKQPFISKKYLTVRQWKRITSKPMREAYKFYYNNVRIESFSIDASREPDYVVIDVFSPFPGYEPGHPAYQSKAYLSIETSAYNGSSKVIEKFFRRMHDFGIKTQVIFIDNGKEFKPKMFREEPLTPKSDSEPAEGLFIDGPFGKEYNPKVFDDMQIRMAMNRILWLERRVATLEAQYKQSQKEPSGDQNAASEPSSCVSLESPDQPEACPKTPDKSPLLLRELQAEVSQLRRLRLRIYGDVQKMIKAQRSKQRRLQTLRETDGK